MVASIELTGKSGCNGQRQPQLRLVGQLTTDNDLKNATFSPPDSRIACPSLQNCPLANTFSKNVATEIDGTRTMGEKLSDIIAKTIGSRKFIIGQGVLLGLWAIWNSVPGLPHFDSYPFIFMNLALSCQAAFAAPIIMMSQNRQSQYDRKAEEFDHEVNVKAEIGVSKILERLDRIEQQFAIKKAA